MLIVLVDKIVLENGYDDEHGANDEFRDHHRSHDGFVGASFLDQNFRFKGQPFFIIQDPARPEVVRVRKDVLHRARKSFGTDEDCIVVDRTSPNNRKQKERLDLAAMLDATRVVSKVTNDRNFEYLRYLLLLLLMLLPNDLIYIYCISTRRRNEIVFECVPSRSYVVSDLPKFDFSNSLHGETFAFVECWNIVLLSLLLVVAVALIITFILSTKRLLTAAYPSFSFSNQNVLSSKRRVYESPSSNRSEMASTIRERCITYQNLFLHTSFQSLLSPRSRRVSSPTRLSVPNRTRSIPISFVHPSILARRPERTSHPLAPSS